MTKGHAGRSLKSLTLKWLVMLAALDVAVVLAFVAPPSSSAAHCWAQWLSLAAW